jgi:putative ribosome biogenesis GTPase RsgA
VQAPDASNMADFLRISPWRVNDVRDALRQDQVNRLLIEAKNSNAPQVIYINLDDSLGEKDKATCPD